ncbi:gp436 family protein [Desulforegula conservatrix]|uniref:gp436 family protein n=1 Tax=Desulforegula conservatrix TaxID=153026 RepID=UPI00040D2101|nr:DUF1320 domain-containing protein [Desulforegula conservatrix]
MPYATLADIQKRFGEDTVLAVSDKDGDGIPDSDVIEAAISDASAVMDAYIAGRTVADILKTRICCDIIMYQMAHDAGSYVDEYRKRYDDSLNLLRHIGKGEISSASEIGTASSGVEFSSSPRIFKRGL